MENSKNHEEWMKASGKVLNPTSLPATYECDDGHQICYRQLNGSHNFCQQRGCKFERPEPTQCNFPISNDCPQNNWTLKKYPKEIRKHQESPERTVFVNCIVTPETCEKVPLKKFEAHLTEVHSMKMVEGNRLEGMLRMEDHHHRDVIARLSMDSHSFYTFLANPFGMKNWHQVTVVNAHESVAQKYSAKTTMWKKDSPFKNELTLPVLSISNASVKDALKSCCCYCTHIVEQGMTMAVRSKGDEKRALCYSMEIKKIDG